MKNRHMYTPNLFVLGCSGSLSLQGVFSSCNKRGLLTSHDAQLLIAIASLLAEHRLWGALASVVGTHGLSSCDSWT